VHQRGLSGLRHSAGRVGVSATSHVRRPRASDGPAATTLITESDALVALRRTETRWLYSRAIEYRPLRGTSPILDITLVGIGAVSLHIVIPLLAVVALSHVVIKFLETYPANSKARFAAKSEATRYKGKSLNRRSGKTDAP
jgi:hypothetical protein